MKETISRLLEITKIEFHDAAVTRSDDNQGIKVSWLANDGDESRQHKRFQPVVIKLHTDFLTSEFASSPSPVIDEEFTSFIRNKRSQFVPRTTDNKYEGHMTHDLWIFPEEC